MGIARFATEKEINDWSDKLLGNHGADSFFQEPAFLELKAQQRISPWRTAYVVHDLGQKRSLYVAYLVKKVYGLGEFWYAPFGPQVSEANELQVVTEQLKALAPKAFTVVFEPTIIISSEKEQRAITATLNSFYKVPPIQPNVHTVTVSLSNTEALFNNLKQRTRRAIRQAEKAKVRVEKAVYTEKTKDTFFLMYKETAKRAGFFIRSKEYYVSFWDSYHKNGQGEFFFAYRGDEEDPIAGVFIVYDEKKALYKDGASVRTGLPSGTLHLLQWEVMKWLESKKVQTYDLHGVPPSWQQDDKNHRQYGLGIFKTSFGETTDYIGALQHDIKPVHAKLWHKVFKKLYFTLASKRGGFFY